VPTKHNGTRRGAFPYPGSKVQLAPWIVEHLPEHECYVEPFGGSAAVLLEKPPSRNEVFNDLDGDIVHFMRTLRDRHDELAEWLRGTPFSRELHRKYAEGFYAGYRPEDDIERAGRWFYLRNTQFAQKYDGVSGFRLSLARNHAVQFQNRVDALEAVRERLSRVQVENLEYADLVDRLDGAETVFYFDPPYVDAGDALYSHDEFDHGRFLDVLDEIEGDWVISYTELPDGLGDGNYVRSREHRGTMRTGQGEWEQTNQERLVMNFDPGRVAQFVDQRTEQRRLVSARYGD
jgi:DNA adenine methylase